MQIHVRGRSDFILLGGMECWSIGVLDSKSEKKYFLIPLNPSLQYSINPILQFGQSP